MAWLTTGPFREPVGPQGSPEVDAPATLEDTEGSPGPGWFTGTGEPPEQLAGAAPGDLYLDLSTGHLYQLS